MNRLTELAPKKKERVIDLLKQAGIKPEKNQTYLSQWAFVQGKRSVINLWYKKQIKQDGEKIIAKLNYPKNCEGKDLAVLNALHHAYALKNKGGKIQVIVLEGIMGIGKKRAIVNRRYLDRAEWEITGDLKARKFTLIRDSGKFIDQFVIQKAISIKKPERHKITTTACARAKGKCELVKCSKRGFRMDDGRIYLETHHVISLSEGGADAESNVVALCPNHHREAHHGKSRKEMRDKLLKQLKRCP